MDQITANSFFKYMKGRIAMLLTAGFALIILGYSLASRAHTSSDFVIWWAGIIAVGLFLLFGALTSLRTMKLARQAMTKGCNELLLSCSMYRPIRGIFKTRMEGSVWSQQTLNGFNSADLKIDWYTPGLKANGEPSRVYGSLSNGNIIVSITEGGVVIGKIKPAQ